MGQDGHLARTAFPDDDARVPADDVFFDDDLVRDLIRMLVQIDAKLDELRELLLEDDDGEEADE